MKKFFSEFKEFINRGSVMDLAVGVIIGGAFTAIINSVVSDLIMPIVSIFTGGINFSDMKLYLPFGSGEAYFAYGNFINALIQFLIIAFVVFVIVRGINRLNRSSKKTDEKKDAPTCPYCLEEIHEGATRCPHCTAQLKSPTTT